MDKLRHSDKIYFVLKLDIEESRNKEKTILYSEIIDQYIENENKKHKPADWVKKVTLYHVERLGLSGSEVFYMDVSNHKNSQIKKLIAKFNSKAKTEEEFFAADDFDNANLTKVSKFFSTNGEVGAIIYNLVNGVNTKEFRKIYLNSTNSDCSCAESIDYLYKYFVSRYISTWPSKKKESSIGEAYDFYLNKRKKKPLLKLKKYMQEKDDASCVHQFCENNFERIFSKRILNRLIHGDLHARNFFASEDNFRNVELIDFGWGGYRHPLKDFTLLEATIKYMLTSEYAFRNNNDDNCYISINDYISFEGNLCQQPLASPIEKSAFYTIEKNSALKRAYLCISKIRENAFIYLKDYQKDCEKTFGVKYFNSPEEEYFISLFIITLGMFGFDTVDQFWILKGCAILSEKICELGNYNETA